MNEMIFAHIREANISHLHSKYITAKPFHLPEGQIQLKRAPAFASALFCLICPKRCVEVGYLPQKYTSGTPKNWIAFSLTVFGKRFYAVLFFNLMRPEFGATMTICSIANFCFPFIATHTATPPNLFSAFGEELFWLQVAISLIIPFFCYFGV